MQKEDKVKEKKKAGEKMKIAEPKCPECGGNEFTYKFLKSEENLRKGVDDPTIDRVQIRKPFAIAYCIKCGYIVGFAGT